MARCILLQDPHHDYAVQLLTRAHERHGLRAVCLYTDRRRRSDQQGAWPALNSNWVEASYDVAGESPQVLAQRLKSRHELVAVVPHVEDSVLPLARLAEALGIPHNPVEVISRFRDKHAMKAHLRQVAPSVRVNRSWPVTGPAAVFKLGEATSRRFVLKPNAGYGNRHVAVLGPHPSRTEVLSYFSRVPGDNHVLEEWIDGPEYFVNGYVDAHGQLDTVAVFAYRRIAANGRQDVDDETCSLRHTDPLFSTCAEYAAKVVAATGLRRSPFHLELKLDSEGPCLIEVAARLPGLGNVHECNLLHQGKVDLFELALCGDLGLETPHPLPLDWAHADRLHIRYVHGIGRRAETVHAVRGLDEVQRLPTFHRWAKRPTVGDRLEPTADCLSLPWSVVLAGTDEAATAADAANVRTLLQINPRASVQTLIGRAQTAKGRAERALRWTLTRLSPPLDGEGQGPHLPTWKSVRDQGGALLEDARGRVERRLLERGIGRHYAGQLDRPLTPLQVQQATQLLDWAQTVLTRPHPQLGRKGPVCPFVQATIDRDRFFFVFHPELDGTDRGRIQDAIFSHADNLKARFPYDTPKAAFTSLLVVLPNVPRERMAVLDLVHDDVKTHTMTNDVMISAFHPFSERPAIWNHSFHDAFKAPLPCFAVRHLDVRDIIFLGHNPSGFAHYHARFHARFEAGEVDDEFGYLTAYNESRKRFNL